MQKHVGRRVFLAQLDSDERDGKGMEYVLAFGPQGTGPPAVGAQGLESKDVEVFVVWTLSADGGTFHQTGSGDHSYCGGDALWTGITSDCYAKCKETTGCRGFVTYSTGTVHSDSNCQLTGSRCTVPRPTSGCGINTPKSDMCGGRHVPPRAHTGFNTSDPACESAASYTLQSPNPPPVVFDLLHGARFNCYAVYSVLGATMPDVCAIDGRLTVKATEAPMYLVGKS